MADGDWKTDTWGKVRALRPGDVPPVSSLYEAFEGREVTASDAIVLRGYLGRSDRIQRVHEYLDRALRIAETDFFSVITTTLTRSIAEQQDLKWDDARDQARAAAAQATARDAGLTHDEVTAVGDAVEKKDGDDAKARCEKLDEAAALLEDEPGLPGVLLGVKAVIKAQARKKQIEDALAAVEIEGTDAEKQEKQENRERFAATLTTADTAELKLLIDALDAVKEIAKPHLPWRLYLTPRLDRYVDFHPSSLIAWRQEPKTERRDACTVWLRVFEKGAQIPIPYRLVHETTLAPSFATWINGQLVDDYAGDDGSGAWGDQVSALKGTGPHCLKGTTRLCLD